MFTILHDQQRSRSECTVVFFLVSLINDNKSSLPPKDNMYLRRRRVQIQNKDKRTTAGI